MPRRKKIEAVNVAALTAELAKIDARRAEIVEALTAERARVAAELAAIDAVVNGGGKSKPDEVIVMPAGTLIANGGIYPLPGSSGDVSNTIKLPPEDPLEVPAFLKRGSA